VILLGIAASRLSGQAAPAPDTATVDRIVAVVGMKPIMLSSVLEEVFARVNDRSEPPPDPVKDPAGYAKLLRRYVDTLVSFELLLHEAQADTTIKVTDQEVNDAADQLLRNARSRFKTEAEFMNGLRGSGFTTAEEFRSSLVDKQRRALTL
jgi:hypothetical protein